MATTNANISIDQIVISWLGKRGYSIHYYWKALLLAQEAVQELGMTSVPLTRHALLTKAEGEHWYTLPEDFSSYLRVGARFGDVWYPVRISERLMPYANTDGQGDMSAIDFGPDTNIQGNKIGWSAGQTYNASFNPADFNPADLQTTSSTIPQVSNPQPPPYDYCVDGWACYNYPYGGMTSQYGMGVYFDIQRGIIMAAEGLAYNELYLVYTGIGAVDQMTDIPVIAQAAIEAYISWKYAVNKRDISRAEAQDWERMFDQQHRLVRARVQRWDVMDVIQAFEDRFIRIPYYPVTPSTNSSSVAAAPVGFGYYIFSYALA